MSEVPLDPARLGQSITRRSQQQRLVDRDGVLVFEKISMPSAMPPRGAVGAGDILISPEF
jgi:hypothetical protein